MRRGNNFQGNGVGRIKKVRIMRGQWQWLFVLPPGAANEIADLSHRSVQGHDLTSVVGTSWTVIDAPLQKCIRDQD